MRVLLISPQPFFSVRGTPIAVRRLAETLCADGHEVDLLTFPFGEDVSIDGLRILRCRRFPGVRRVGIGFSIAKLLQDVMLAWELWRLGKPWRYDVVHAVEESVYPALLLRRRHRAAVIYDMDSSLADQMAGTHRVFRTLLPITKRIERWAIRSVDLVAPVCPDLAHYAATVRDSRDVVVLHDAPLDGLEAADPVEGLWDAETGDRCLALYVGNLEAYQGIDLMVDAMGRLPPDSPIRVVVVGGAKADVERYRSIVSQGGLGGRIRFVGPRPLEALRSVLSEADILLSPRTQGNNTPLKLYSYMDSGRAILATRLRTHTQVLDDSTALLVEPEPRAFARGLVRLAEDEELRRRLAASAKRRVTHNYSLAAFNDRVRDIYPRSRKAPPPHAANGSLGAAANGRRVLELTCRRTNLERRSGTDRRTSPRSTHDSRVASRRALISPETLTAR
jgi:glycosyltransferase involved in cell wall biosynthesis